MITLFLGGASSGKSRVAEEAARRHGDAITYVSTWYQGAGGADPEMDARVRRHRERRPPSWTLRELVAGEQLGDVLTSLTGGVLLDALGTWVAGAPEFRVDADELCRSLCRRAGDTIVVSDEVGMGVHPTSAAGRDFRSALGDVNAAVARVADEVWLVVAGRLLRLDQPGTERRAGQ